jgi:hypothetical protein
VEDSFQEPISDSIEERQRELIASISLSRLCKTQCIDKGWRFCPSLDHRSGKCYNYTDYYQNIDGCSTDVPMEDLDLQYWLCNYNTNCTDNFVIQPNGFGSSTNLVTLTPKNKWVFLENFCNYRLEHPAAAG